LKAHNPTAKNGGAHTVNAVRRRQITMLEKHFKISRERSINRRRQCDEDHPRGRVSVVFISSIGARLP
jgi:hypothetical protein